MAKHYVAQRAKEIKIRDKIVWHKREIKKLKNKLIAMGVSQFSETEHAAIESQTGFNRPWKTFIK